MATDHNSPQYYSQVTAAAMSLQLEEQADEIRQLRRVIEALDREAVQQAEEILQLRDESTRWRTWYAQLTPQPAPPAAPPRPEHQPSPPEPPRAMQPVKKQHLTDRPATRRSRPRTTQTDCPSGYGRAT